MIGSFWIEVALCLGTAGIFLYVFIKQKYKYFEKRGIPNDDPFLIFGNAWEALVLKENLPQTVTKLYNRYPEAKLIGMYQGLRPIYIPRDPELVARITIREFSHFHDRGIVVYEDTNPLDSHLFNLSGAKWKTLRNKMTPTFTSGKLKGMYPIMDSCVDSFIDSLGSVVGEDVDVKEALCRVTTDVIGSCAFGLDSDAVRDPQCQFRKMGKKLFNPGPWEQFKLAVQFTFPKVHRFFRMKTMAGDVESFFTGVIKETLDLRSKSGVRRKDFVQLLLELKEKGEVKADPIELRDEDDAYLYSKELIENSECDDGKITLTDDLLTAQAFVFLIGGFETSATGLSFTVYELSKHQEVQEKLRQNVREVKERFGGITYSALKAMDYLEACIKEGLRMYPPVRILLRQCNKSIAVDDGVSIESGANIMIPVQGIQSDPAYFPDPETFRPERFIESDPLPGTYLPFGDGPRICIAQRFALVEMKLALAKMVDEFRIETCPKMEAYEPLKMDPGSFIPSPVGGLFVRLEPLKSFSS